MVNKLILIIALLFAFVYADAQSDKKYLKNAERHIGFEEYDQAIPQLEQALKINSKNAMTQFMLGKCLFLTHEKNKAVEHLAKAVELNPEVDPGLNGYYAKALHYKLDFDNAITYYRKAMTSISSKSPEFHAMEIAIKQCQYGKFAVEKPVEAKIVNIGSTINTEYIEHSPVISADESILIFTSRRPGNTGSAKDGSWHDEDLYMSTRVNGKWTTPVNLGKGVNKPDHDASISLSADGQHLYIYKNPPGKGDIFECELDGDKWSSPTNIGSPISDPKAFESAISISADGRTAYFGSDRPGGKGNRDIWTVTKDEKGKWGKPKNLPAPINSAYNDDSPFLHPNGRTLYFSSDGPNSIGGYDIFKTELQDDGSWSEPQNMGYPINTADHDIYFVMSADGKHGYYSSAKEGGYGHEDIYQVIMPQPKVVANKEVKDSTKTEPVIVKNPLTILKGTVTDEVTGNPVGSEIKVIDDEKNMVIAEFKSNSTTGKYLVSLPSGRNYGIRVESEGYLFHSEHFDIPQTTDYQEIVKDVKLKKMEVGTSIVLRNIFFDHNAATLRSESEAELERLHQLMTDYPTLEIEIGGHTDSDGSNDYNQKLSERRAKAVVDYLLKKGVETTRMQAKGYGESEPIDSNDTDEGKQNNRRTEFKILKN